MASFVPGVVWLGAGVALGYVLFGRKKESVQKADSLPSASSAAAVAPAPNKASKLAERAARGGGGRGEHKMVLVVRTDLKMGSGKIAAQCGHATLGAYKAAVKRGRDEVKRWSSTGQAKIALRCPTQEEMHALAEAAEAAGIVNYTVVDAGRTQIEEGSETVLAIGPAPKEIIDQITGHLKLL